MLKRADLPKQDILTPSDPSLSPNSKKFEFGYPGFRKYPCICIFAKFISRYKCKLPLLPYTPNAYTNLARADYSSAIAQGAGATALAEGATQVNTEGGDAILGDIHAEQDVTLGDKITAQTIVIAKDGATVYLGEQPIEMPAVDRDLALGQIPGTPDRP